MQWPLVHSRHRMPTASVQVHNILISPKENHSYSPSLFFPSLLAATHLF